MCDTPHSTCASRRTLFSWRWRTPQHATNSEANAPTPHRRTFNGLSPLLLLLLLQPPDSEREKERHKKKKEGKGVMNAKGQAVAATAVGVSWLTAGILSGGLVVAGTMVAAGVTVGSVGGERVSGAGCTSRPCRFFRLSGRRLLY